MTCSNEDVVIAMPKSPKRVIGIWSACSVVSGVMIGSGIFFLPSLVMEYSGSVGMFLIVWILCGVAAFVGGLCWAELALTFPRSGGNHTVFFSMAYRIQTELFFLCYQLMIICENRYGSWL